MGAGVVVPGAGPRRESFLLAALRAALADRYAVATANASVNAIRGALRGAWLSGDMDQAMLERSLAALRQVRGNAAPGRALSPVEARELFEAAGGDRNHAAGARDAALLALAYGAGLRRAELAAARLADLDGDTLGVHGKGRRERIAYLGANGCAAAVSAWIAVRGTEDGPLFRPVNSVQDSGVISDRQNRPLGPSGAPVLPMMERMAEPASLPSQPASCHRHLRAAGGCRHQPTLAGSRSIRSCLSEPHRLTKRLGKAIFHDGHEHGFVLGSPGVYRHDLRLDNSGAMETV